MQMQTRREATNVVKTKTWKLFLNVVYGIYFLGQCRCGFGYSAFVICKEI